MINHRYSSSVIGAQEALKRTWKEPGISEVTEVLCDFDSCVSQQTHLLRKNCFSQVTFEDLEKDTLKELKRIYSELNLRFTLKFEKEVLAFMESNKNYSKSSYQLKEEEKELIRECMETFKI